MNQGRFVSYIYRYNRSDERCENAGFVKVSRLGRSGEGCRVHIGLKDYRKRRQVYCMVYIFYAGNDKKAKGEAFGELMLCNGDGTLKREISYRDVTGSGRQLADYDGMLFLSDDGDVFCTRWNDREVPPSQIDISPVENNDGDRTAEAAAGMADAPADMADTPDTSAEAASDDSEETDCEYTDNETAETESMGKETACSRMIKTCPRLPQMDDRRFIECVRIEPQDIGSMNMANWRLGTNSFLSHGYHNYKYLMLGKLLFGGREERYVIGVPGVYSNKEKYLANMFGFTVFIPVKNKKTMTGNFGYWIVEVVE